MIATNHQVDGNHYKKFKRQPIVLCNTVGHTFSFAVACIFKHLTRYPFKGEAKTDLEKVKHYFLLHRQLFESQPSPHEYYHPIRALEEFISENEIDYKQAYILRAAMNAVIVNTDEVVQEFFTLVDTTIAQLEEQGMETSTP